MQINTSRLIIRSFVQEDSATVSRNSQTPIVSHYMSDMVFKEKEQAAGWIAWLNGRCNDTEPFQVLAIELKEGCVIGLVGIAPKHELNGEIEILFSIADEYQNHGYGTEAAKAIIWWAFEQAGKDVLSAIVKPENKASRRVIEKLGFVYCDTRTLPYDGADCMFDYFRLYHTDTLPGPEWDINTLYSLEPMGAFFDNRAQGYNEHMLHGGGEEDYIRLGSFFPQTEDRLNILDIGCGTGIELDYIWAQAPNAQITCVDLSQGMLELLLSNHPEKQDRIHIIQASYLDWDYPESKYDIVVSSNTMHHFWEMEKGAVYRKILWSLKAGGYYFENDFIVNDVLSEQYRQRHARITSSLPQQATSGQYHIDIPFTVEVQRRLLFDAGFGTVEVLADDTNHGNGAILKAIK